MSRVLLLCPEPLGHKNPAGVGIRFIEFARALVADGHSVTVLSPDSGAIDGCRSDIATAETITRYTSESDVAVVQGHIANELFFHGSAIPVVVDLYDPFIVENLHYNSTLGDKVFLHDHATFMRSLREGDFFLCASEDQRLFYLGALLVAGRLNPMAFNADTTLSQLVSVVPFGVPQLRDIPTKRLHNPSVLFGGIYDWYDPLIAIDAVARVRKEIPGITLTFTNHPNVDTTPQSKFSEAARHAEKHGLGNVVTFEPWVPYSERASFYDRFAAALLTFRPSIETDLSMRTRIFDYLWAGIPVISSSAPGTDPIIENYGAGTIVRSFNADDYAAALLELLRDPDEYQRKVNATQRFASDYQWPELLEPLLDFCRSPRVDEAKQMLARAERSKRRSILGTLKRKLGS